MTLSLNDLPETPTQADAKLAQESGRRLAKILGRPNRRNRTKKLQLRIQAQGKPAQTLAIPYHAFELLAGILNQMAQGHAVTLTPVQSELTTQQAANFLDVSRPYLIDLLEKGAMPYRKVGAHRRILFRDALAYKQQQRALRFKALEELTAQAQELGMGY